MAHMKTLTRAATLAVATLIAPAAFAASDTAEPVDQTVYEGRETLPDPTEGSAMSNARWSSSRTICGATPTDRFPPPIAGWS